MTRCEHQRMVGFCSKCQDGWACEEVAMTDNIIDFPKTQELERLVWVCDCGCTTFYHFAGGGIECAACGAEPVHDPDNWRNALPPEPDEPKDRDENAFKVVNLGGASAFLLRQSKSKDDVAFAMVAFSDGSVATWSDISTDEQRAWVRRRFAEALKRMGCEE